jgi:muramoyltetrapeptide carboxypeptidase
VPTPFTLPPPLKPGDRVRVIAPSSPFDRTLVLRGIAWLGERYRVDFAWGMFERTGFLAGADERRLSELNQALGEAEVRAIVAARGGYGLSRIAHLGAWHELLRNPKWIVGFSDVTALHVEAQRLRIASLHADNVAALGRGDARARARLLSALEAPLAKRRFAGLSCWRAGGATGPLVGGNLTLLATAAIAGRLTLPDGAVLAVEDVTEASYRVDRMLSGLLAGGHLDRVAAVVVGDFSDCTSAPHGVPIEHVLRERFETLGVPIVAGVPFGHGAVNEPLHLGTTVRVDASAGCLELGA